jgi:hypothetical protein
MAVGRSQAPPTVPSSGKSLSSTISVSNHPTKPGTDLCVPTKLRRLTRAGTARNMALRQTPDVPDNPARGAADPR